MKNFYLVSYEIAGIKCLDKEAKISFYKKNATKIDDTKKYHIKGIYGMNGTGKSGIITSVKIIKGLLLQSNYLYNPLLQKQLSELVNKSSNELRVKLEFMIDLDATKRFYQYEINISNGARGFFITQEKLWLKNAISRNAEYKQIFEVRDGELTLFDEKVDETFKQQLVDSTKNLLQYSTLVSVFYEKLDSYTVVKEILDNNIKNLNELFFSLMWLHIFAESISVYLDDADKHMEYFWYDEISRNKDKIEVLQRAMEDAIGIEKADNYSYLTPGTTVVAKSRFNDYKEAVDQLSRFLKKFKSELIGIDIDKKIDHDTYVCNLNMRYKEYSINTEFESTGIKKLIKLYMYFKRMVNGDIVFIDEFDSNLHDVYLCALLEYMMEYGEGQLIFTTHNVGPMNILQKNKKSIDFISVNHQVYSWVNNGNYSAAKLYREGMIEGSPFNIEAIDFIGLFEVEDN